MVKQDYDKASDCIALLAISAHKLAVKSRLKKSLACCLELS